ncbi:MAG: hypothetical protein KGY76_04610 [Candidatus Thermoplasmatota archaeon]|nr:hypothetical protein [Candidatus Thermoplasmatota archaeon]
MQDSQRNSENTSKQQSILSILKDHEFVIEQKFFSLGKKYIIKNSERERVAFSKRESLKVKEDIKVYKTEKEEKELFRIKQENVLNFNGLFGVTDPEGGEVIGYLKRKGVRSLINDEWQIMDPSKDKIGSVIGDSLVKEAIRRKSFKYIPHRYKIYHRGEDIGIFKQRLTLLRRAYKLQIKDDPDFELDRRLLISLAICLDAVEDRFRKLKNKKVF